MLSGRIESWKEIAAYLSRGVRTVQRWEREAGLPVHRLQHAALGSVYAYKSELDDWRESRKPLFNGALPRDSTPLVPVAVLPFSDMSRERDQGHICEGLAEEIIGALSRIRGVRVASRSSSFRFRDSGTAAMLIARELRAGAILEGSIRRRGDRIRISAQLVDASSGYQIWSDTFDRGTEDVFAVEREIATSVARAIEKTLAPGQPGAASDLYLRGRAYYFRYSVADMECAIQLFHSAIARDPDFALAYAGLADCWSYLYLYSERSDALREQAEWAGQRAVQLDSNCAQSHASLALALSLDGRDEEARLEFETALALDPGHFEARLFYARYCAARGDREQAAALYEESIRLRPADYQSPLLLAQIYEDLRHSEDAREMRLHGIELAEQHLRSHPDDVRALYLAAAAMAATGNRSRAREFADRALAMRPTDSMVLYNVGCVYLRLGNREDAQSALQRAAEYGLCRESWDQRELVASLD